MTVIALSHYAADAERIKDIWVPTLAKCGIAMAALMPGSRAAGKGYMETQANPELKATAFRGRNYICILESAGLCVLDADPRSWSYGCNPIAQLFADVGASEFLRQCKEGKTLIVQTGGKPVEVSLPGVEPTAFRGLHMWFRLPEAYSKRQVSFATSHQKYKGLELKTLSITGPGALHIETGYPYLVLTDDLAHPFRPKSLQDFPLLPEAICQLFIRSNNPSLARWQVTEQDWDDSTRNVQRFVSLLLTSPVSKSGEQGNNTAYRTACRGKSFNLSPEKTLESLLAHWNDRCIPPWSESDLARIVDNAYRYARVDKDDTPEDINDKAAAIQCQGAKWDRTETGAFKPTANNLYNILGLPDHNKYVNPLYGLLRMNRHGGMIEYACAPPWEGATSVWRGKTDVHLLRGYLGRTWGLRFPIGEIETAVIDYSSNNSWHPLQEWMSSLDWDGVSRLRYLFSVYLGASDSRYREYYEAIALCWMVAAVKRTFEPGCVFQYMPILEGPQGLQKSFACQVLGGDYYAALRIDPNSPETLRKMRGRLILEVAELTGMKKADIDAMKAFLTASSDHHRNLYDENQSYVPRQSVFIGTFNPGAAATYLVDPTGNRRYWPVKCQDIDIEALKRDRTQLFAEAVHLYRAGYPVYLADPNLEALAREMQESRRVLDPWVGILSEHFRLTDNTPATESLLLFRVLDIKPNQATTYTNMRLLECLKTLGAEQVGKGTWKLPK